MFPRDVVARPASLSSLLAAFVVQSRAVPIFAFPSATGTMDAFGGYLYMVYSSNTRSELYMSRTSDDSNWVNTQRIPNQNTSCPLLAAFGDYLYMVYTSNI